MKITLGPGEDKTLSLEGYGFYIVAADGPVIAELRELDGNIDESGVLLPGQGLQGKNRFEKVRVINMHSAAQEVQFYVGPRTFIDNRNVGVVSIEGTVSVDPVQKMSVKTFRKSYTRIANEGFLPFYEIKNPINSGIEVFVRSIFARSSNGVIVAHKSITTTTGGVEQDETIELTGIGGIQKAKVYTGEGLSDPRSAFGLTSEIYSDLNGGFERSDNAAPISLKEGEAITVFSINSGVELVVSIEWEER